MNTATATATAATLKNILRDAGISATVHVDNKYTTTNGFVAIVGKPWAADAADVLKAAGYATNAQPATHSIWLYGSFGR